MIGWALLFGLLGWALTSIADAAAQNKLAMQFNADLRRGVAIFGFAGLACYAVAALLIVAFAFKVLP